MSRVSVLCVGNAWRGDDGAGPAVAQRLDGRLPAGVALVRLEGEPAALLAALDGVDTAIIVDAVRSGAQAGHIHRLDAGAGSIGHEEFRSSTHSLGILEAVELARALGRLPRTTVVYGIETGSVGHGEGLTPEVGFAVERVADAVVAEVESAFVEARARA